VSLLSIKRDTTSKLLRIFVQDSSASDGSGLTGLTSASSGLVWWYIREGAAAEVQVTLAAGTLGTWSSGGFIEIDATNLPGGYELGVPDAALASGTDSLFMMLSGASNMAPVPIEIQLTQTDLARDYSGTVTVSAPVSSDGETVTIVQGDDYNASDNRELSFTSTDWPDLTSPSDATVTMTANKAGEASAFSVTGSVVDASTVQFEPTAAQTAIAIGLWNFDVQATLATSSRVITLVRGKMTVLEDQT
jgi:hypothetical protein